MARPDEPRASWWEILGARLRIWTPPRDVEIPPVSRRALALTIAGLALAAVAAAAFLAPAIDRSKQERAARERAERAAFVARRRALLVADQRPRHARAARAAALYRAGRTDAARAALLADVQRSVNRDASARFAGARRSGGRTTRCRYVRGDGGRLALRCIAITSTLVINGETTVVGQPFVVRASLRDGRYAWCHENPLPGEGSAAKGVIVPLSAECAI